MSRYRDPRTAHYNRYQDFPHVNTPQAQPRNKLRNNGNPQVYTGTLPQPIGYNYSYLIDIGDSVAGYFEKTTLSNGQSQNGYYNSLGTQLSGNCSGSCEVYSLVQDLNTTLASGDEKYYYLVTRDTNILVLTANVNSSSLGDKNVPFTATASNQSAGSTNTAIGGAYISGAYQMVAGNDLVIENINFNYTPPRGSADNSDTINTGDSGIFANFHNVKFGRNVKNRNNAVTRITEGFYGGDAGNAAVNSYKTFKVIIESGVFRYFIGGGATAKNYYLYEQAILGSDFDIADSKNNTRLRFYFTTIAVYRGNLMNQDLTKANVVKTEILPHIKSDIVEINPIIPK